MNEALQILAVIFGFSGFVISLIAVAMIAGFTRSTHTVQYVPMDEKMQEVAEENEELILQSIGKKKKETFEDEGSPDDEIAKTDFIY
jgi:hypothetical protein